jgi:type II secretory pathway component GspD/PulD (secretin)
VPGPLRVIDGVSVGFVHSEAGAEAAAAHYLVEIERAMDTLDAEWTSKVASLVSTGAEARAITSHAAAVIALERSDGAPLRRVAISTDPVVFSATAAQVTVLESWIYATNAEEALWAVERVSLAWENGGWRVSAITGGSPSADESLADLRSQLSFPGPGDASVR